VIASLTDNLPHTVLECLGAGIPFVASRVGGIPEMVADEDRDAVLFPLRAEALAERLQQALDEGVGTARPAIDFDANERAWVAWHASLAGRKTAADVASEGPQIAQPPLVSVCLTDLDDSDWHARAVAAVEEQDYGSVEVVTVDAREVGAGRARDEAARRAAGEYLMFLGNGDLPRPEMVSTLVGVAERTGADVVTCCVDYAEVEEGKPSAVVTRWVPLGPSLAVGVFEDCFGGPNMLVRRDEFLSVGGFAGDYRAGVGDREFYVKAATLGLRHELVPEPLLWSRMTGEVAASPGATYADDTRAARALAGGVPPGLQELALLAQSLEVANRDMEKALARQAKELNSVKSDRFNIRRERDLALKGRRLAVRRWRRYRSAYRALMNKSPLRAYRAAKRALLSLLGRSEGGDEERPDS
jgi:hypothetical protein